MNHSSLSNNDTIKLISVLTKTDFSQITTFVPEKESSKYHACSFQLNEKRIVYRKAYITPTKTGQFVTFWKRNTQKQTAPFSASDTFDFFFILTTKDHAIGFFMFPKSILIEKGIISSQLKPGKRGFRVYPPWDITRNKQATQTQQWQLNYFTKSN